MTASVLVSWLASRVTLGCARWSDVTGTKSPSDTPGSLGRSGVPVSCSDMSDSVASNATERCTSVRSTTVNRTGISLPNNADGMRVESHRSPKPSSSSGMTRGGGCHGES